MIRSGGWMPSSAAGARRKGSNAIKLLESLPNTPERAQKELDLLSTLALTTMFAKGFGSREGVEHYERAVALSRRLGDNRKLFGILSPICAGRAERGELAFADGM